MLIATFGSLLLSGSLGFAPPPQDGGSAAPPTGSKGDDVLKGPRVPEDAAGKGKGGFGDDMKGGKGAKGGEGAMRGGMMLMGVKRALESIRKEFPNEDWTKVDALVADTEAKSKAFREANADKMRTIEEQVRKAKESGGMPDPALMEEMKKLRESAPNPEAVMTQLKSLLSPEAQQAVRDRMAKMREEMMGKRGGEGKDGKRGEGKRGPGKPGQDGKAPPPKDPDMGEPFDFGDDDKPAKKP